MLPFTASITRLVKKLERAEKIRSRMEFGLKVQLQRYVRPPDLYFA